MLLANVNIMKDIEEELRTIKDWRRPSTMWDLNWILYQKKDFNKKTDKI
jgi:hypothetical protein